MTALRVIQAVTFCAFLVLVATAWVFRFDPHGYNQTLGALRAHYGDGAYIFIAAFSVISLVSVPAFALTGVIVMVFSRRLGRSAFVMGLLCCLLSGANLVLWKNYGGIPAGNGASGVTPVTTQATPKPRQKPAGNGPQK